MTQNPGPYASSHTTYPDRPYSEQAGYDPASGQVQPGPGSYAAQAGYDPAAAHVDPERSVYPAEAYAAPGSYAPVAQDHPWHGGGAQIDPQDRTTAMWAHLALSLGLLCTAGVGAVVVPLVLWFTSKDTKPFVRHAAATSFNAACTTLLTLGLGMLLYTVGLSALTEAAVPMIDGGQNPLTMLGILAVLGFAGPLLMVLVGVAAAAVGIVAAVRTQSGREFRYRPVLPILR